MDVPKIEKLSDLLSNYLGHERSIIEHETSRLTATGENYGSRMLALKILVKNKDQIETLEIVAKIPPPGEFMQKMFNTPVSFRNEIDFYQTIIPEISSFLHEKGLHDYIDFIPEFLGARLNLENTNELVHDAILLLENLKLKDYEMLDRNIGFDYQTSKAVITALAKYHAAPLALKLLRPDVFEKKIKPLFKPYKIFDFDDSMLDLVIEKNRKIVEDIESCKQYVPKLIDAFKTAHMIKNDALITREPFATIIHTDAWVNNFMVRYQNRVPVGCKLVDFQLDEYGSPARDVVFFIFTSVQIPIAQKYCDDLLKLYHQTLIDNLERFGCDPAPFSYEEFHKEIELVVKESEFFHCMIMLQPIYARKEDLKELDEYNEEDLTTHTTVTHQYKERVEFIIKEFVKRKWI